MITTKTVKTTVYIILVLYVKTFQTTSTTNLINNIFFGRSPQQLANDAVEWPCVSTAIGSI